jgi:ABC-2 type transport system ATP-binding protein
VIRALAATGTTVLLTTQYLEEADQLADAISVIAAGRVVAAGSPDELKSLTGGDRIDVVLREVGDLTLAARLLQARLGGDVSVDQDSRELSVPVADRLAAGYGGLPPRSRGHRRDPGRRRLAAHRRCRHRG